MTQLTLSKSTYLKESKKLANYNRYLPSLDLKRQQLMIEKNKAKASLAEAEEQLRQLLTSSAEQLHMLANQEMQLGELVQVDQVEIIQQNLMGVLLPQLKKVSFVEIPHGYLTQPHWVDLLVKYLKRAAELKLKCDIQKQRVELLSYAVRKATQRVNLVSKILIPQASQNMRRISIFLSDNERAAVVRSKLAKNKKRVQLDQELEL